jgi:hypothetical protein
VVWDESYSFLSDRRLVAVKIALPERFHNSRLQVAQLRLVAALLVVVRLARAFGVVLGALSSQLQILNASFGLSQSQPMSRTKMSNSRNM